MLLKDKSHNKSSTFKKIQLSIITVIIAILFSLVLSEIILRIMPIPGIRYEVSLDATKPIPLAPNVMLCKLKCYVT